MHLLAIGATRKLATLHSRRQRLNQGSFRRWMKRRLTLKGRWPPWPHASETSSRTVHRRARLGRSLLCAAEKPVTPYARTSHGKGACSEEHKKILPCVAGLGGFALSWFSCRFGLCLGASSRFAHPAGNAAGMNEAPGGAQRFVSAVPVSCDRSQAGRTCPN